MAVIYFTNNADRGDGSLRWAITQAQPGDVIQPDESVFERGSIIEITLVSTLIIDKTLTLDGGPYRVRLNAGGAIRCARASGGDGVKFAAFDFVNGAPSAGDGGCVSASVPLTLERCGFYGGVGDYGGGVFARSTLTLNDCVVTGCRARTAGGGVASLNGLTLRGTTIVGNVSANANSDAVRHEGGDLSATNSIVGPVRATGGGALSYPGSVVDVALSQIGFVVAPPDDFSVNNWTANAWQNWDLRLLDDASGAPSPYRDSGDVGAMSRYDLDGNFRGRETNDGTACSPGAYETIQADLFWIGRDATGAEVASPSWVNANGWGASRFATVSGNVAPQSGNAVFVDGSIVFDGNGLRLSKFIVGGGASLGFDNSSGATLTGIADQFDVGAGATLRTVGTSTQRFQIGRASLASRFGDWVNIQPLFMFGDAAGLEIAPTTRFTSVASSVKLYANGFYTSYNLQIQNVATVEGGASGCDNIYVSFQKPTARIAATGTPRVACKTVKWTPPTDATSDFTALEAGSSPIVFVPSRSATVAGNGSRNDFLIDVSNAQTYGTLALTLTGQTVNGDALSSAVALTGVATIGERGLTSQSLTLNADSTLTVDGAKVNVGTLTVADGATAVFSGVDAVLAATETATVGAATFTGVGYFATPPETDATAATFAETVRTCDYGANIQSFSATAVSASDAKLEWTQTDSAKYILIERRDDNGWNIVSDAIADESPYEIALDGRQQFRVFDGDKFLYDDAYFAVKSFYIYSISSTQKGVESFSLYSRKVQMVRANIEGARNENILLLAQIKNLLTGEFLAQQKIESIVASVYKVEKGVQSGDVWTELPEWKQVDVPLDTVLESPVILEGWTNDEVGANFVWTPNSKEKKLFSEGGKYVIQITFNLTDDNPVVISFNVSVK